MHKCEIPTQAFRSSPRSLHRANMFLSRLPALAVLTFASLSLARPQTSLNDLPQCAQQAGLTAISATGCPLTNVTCICGSVPFIQTLRNFIETSCSPSDQQGNTSCHLPTVSSEPYIVPRTSSTDTLHPKPSGTDLRPKSLRLRRRHHPSHGRHATCHSWSHIHKSRLDLDDIGNDFGRWRRSGEQHDDAGLGDDDEHGGVDYDGYE